MELQLTEDETRRLLKLGCQAIHRSVRARELHAQGHTAAAFAEYYAMDTGPLARAYNVLPDNIKATLEEMVANSEGEGK